jgi:hypothetical protein
MAQKAFTYSFADVVATIKGPNGFVSLGNGAGLAEEGISIEFTEEKSTMHIGADGFVAHNLHMSKAGKVTVRVMKVSPTNALLEKMYNADTISSLFHGQNLIMVNQVITGDVYSCQQAAFAKFPHNTYAKEIAMMDWEFNVGVIDVTLGGAGLLIL